MTSTQARQTARANSLGDGSLVTATRIAELATLAQRGLAQMRTPDGNGFFQTVRGIRTPRGSELRGEGDSLRYAAISALGLGQLPVAAQREVLDGSTAAELAESTAARAIGHRDPGAVALAAWAVAEVCGRYEANLFDELSATLASGGPLPTVDASWIVTAAVAAKDLGATDQISELAATKLLTEQGPGGLFPHMLPAGASGRFRAHIGSFADQVYPIQALARLAATIGSTQTLDAANRCAEAICDLQGAAGQWWWHYDSRTREVVEGYPVYSVHQHAMAPMVLFDLLEAGGGDHRPEITLGLDWLRTHPEVMDELISARHGVVWRKVGRREPAKAARSISAVTTSLRSGMRVPGLDALLPPQQIDYECRPYELSWLLCAWLSRGGLPPSTDK